jgi:hypothetical protein
MDLAQHRHVALGTENQLRGGCVMLPSHSNDLADVLAATAFPSARDCTRERTALPPPALLWRLSPTIPQFFPYGSFLLSFYGQELCYGKRTELALLDHHTILFSYKIK